MNTGVVPFGPLPVGEGGAGSLLQLPTSLHVDQPVSGVSAITPAQRLCDAQSMIFRNVIEDSVSLIQPCAPTSLPPVELPRWWGSRESYGP
jgi:hypothetical protein